MGCSPSLMGLRRPFRAQLWDGLTRGSECRSGLAPDFLGPCGTLWGVWLGNVVEAERVSKFLTVRDLICAWCGTGSRIPRCVAGRTWAFFQAVGRTRLACPPPAAQAFEPAGSRCFPAPFPGL